MVQCLTIRTKVHKEGGRSGHAEKSINKKVKNNKLDQYAEELTRHSTQCGGSVLLIGETKDGIASILTGKCSTCEHTITLEFSSRGYYRWESNLAAVCGETATGGRHSHLEVTMTVLGVPVMSMASFINTESDI